MGACIRLCVCAKWCVCMYIVCLCIMCVKKDLVSEQQSRGKGTQVAVTAAA